MGRAEKLEADLKRRRGALRGKAEKEAQEAAVQQQVVDELEDELHRLAMRSRAAILDGKLTPRQGLEKLMQYPLRLEDFDAPKRSSEFS